MKRINLEGLIPAVVLPQTPDYRIDERSYRRYLEWLIPQGIVGIAVNADTGEGPHLYREEKVRALEVAVEVAAGRVAVISGLSASFTAQAIDLARDAERAGADGLLVFPIPAFRGAKADDVIVSYHKAIAEAVDLPLILFQLQPDLGGVDYTPEALGRLVEIEKVVGIKEASFDALKFVNTVALLRSLPRKITILTGNDNFILESFILGAEGALIGFGTLAVREQVEMIQAVRRRDYDRAFALYELILPLEQVIFGSPIRDYRARTKEALQMLGLIEHTTVRPPLLQLSPEEKAKVRKAMEKFLSASRPAAAS